jgi:hypothetical protein
VIKIPWADFSTRALSSVALVENPELCSSKVDG